MRYLSVWVGATVVAAVIIGCGPGKQLPDDVPKPQGTERGGEPKESAPTASDPAAKEIIDRAIKACTQGNPDHLKKARTSKSVAEGTMRRLIDNVPVEVPATRTVLARWPDELSFSFAYKAPTASTLDMILRGSFFWWGQDGRPLPNPNPQAMEEMVRTNGTGQHWLPLLFVAADAKAVVFDPKKGTGSPPADAVSLALPNRPVYRLWFDPATGHLARVEYTHVEFQTRVHTTWSFADHKPFDGLILPTKLEYTYHPEKGKKEVVERWAVEKWEFPDKLDDGAFEPPK